MTKENRKLVIIFACIAAAFLLVIIYDFSGGEVRDAGIGDVSDMNDTTVSSETITRGSSAEDDGESAVDPVSRGNSEASALSIIQAAGHDCAVVTAAVHLPDSTLATCEDGERYRISRITVNGTTATLAMKCSAAEAAGVSCL